MQGLDADPGCQDLVEKRTDAEHELSSEQIEAVMTALYGAGRYGIAQGGHVSADLAHQPTFVVDVSLTFPQVKLIWLSSQSECRRQDNLNAKFSKGFRPTHLLTAPEGVSQQMTCPLRPHL